MKTEPAPNAGFRSVVFDCDSTLVRVEGVDELAGDRTADVRRLTERAMAGDLPLEAVYGRRMELIRPDAARLRRLAARYAATLVPDAAETVAALRWLGKEVRIVSGGLRGPVRALADLLELSDADVAAVEVRLDADGGYLDFDRTSPLTRHDGKAEIIRAWRLPGPSLLVGDGATDLAARPSVTRFAAYAGVARRDAVLRAADLVLHAKSLAPVLTLASGPADRSRLRSSPHADLLQRGDRLLASEPVH